MSKKLSAKDVAQVRTGKCSCGHTQIEHGQETKYTDQENRVLFGEGHGGCAVPNCSCPQFTWVSWS